MPATYMLPLMFDADYGWIGLCSRSVGSTEPCAFCSAAACLRFADRRWGLASSVRCRAVGPPAFPLSDSHQLPPAFAGTVQSRSATRLVVSRVSRCKAEAAALRAIVLERCLLAQRGGPCHATLMRPASCRPHLLILLDHHVLNLLLRQGLMSILG